MAKKQTLPRPKPNGSEDSSSSYVTVIGFCVLIAVVLLLCVTCAKHKSGIPVVAPVAVTHVVSHPTAKHHNKVHHKAKHHDVVVSKTPVDACVHKHGMSDICQNMYYRIGL